MSTFTLKLLKTIAGVYKPDGREVTVLGEIARLNKLYLPFLRAVGNAMGSELRREEARYKWFLRNVVEVVEALRGLDYALYKFRRPVEHVSVDLDVLVRVEHASRAARALVGRGFRVVVWEPYTLTLERGGFIVDLYTHPSFAWAVYMNGERLLRCCAEEVDICGARVRALTRDAEVAVAAAHAVYKEHIVLLMDCLVAWSWMERGVWDVAAEHRVEGAVEVLLEVCDLVRSGAVEAPHKLGPHVLAWVYLEKAVRDLVFRATLPNIAKYILSRRDGAKAVVMRLTRRSY